MDVYRKSGSNALVTGQSTGQRLRAAHPFIDGVVLFPRYTLLPTSDAS